MSALKLEQFGGMLPAWDPHLLPTGQAAYSENGYLFSGALTGWRKPKVLRNLTDASARMAFRIPTVTQAQARAFLLFILNPSSGHTATVGDLTYRFVTTLSDPLDVLIGATPEDTALNFINAVTADDGQNTNAGVTYGENTVENGDVYFTLPGTDPRTGMADPSTGDVFINPTTYAYASVGARDFGASFNNLTVSATGGHVQWNYDLAALGNTTSTFVGGSNPVFDSSITGAATWLEFQDPDTNVVKSPVIDDQWNRYYWASPSDLPKYNTYDRIHDGDAPWLLGVPEPGCAVTLSVEGGGNNMTLGHYTQSGGAIFFGGNRIYLVPITTPGDTQISDVQWRLSGALGVPDQNTLDTTKWAAVIYEDDNGVPGNLLNTGQIVNGVTNDVPNISSFLNPTSLLNNTQFWIGIIIDKQNYFEGGPAGGGSDMASFDAIFSNGPPGTAPTATLGGLSANIWGDFVTSDVIESRAYVYTWVSDYSEEGPPSPPTLLDGWSNGVWTLGLWQPPPDDIGVLRNLKKINIYRTVPGQGGSTVFFYVDTVDIGTSTYVDSKPDNTVALNDQLKSTNWFPPPGNLQGVTVMQNGMIAGFVGNEIWFCEPYRPHAWPPGYVLTTDFTIVGLGVTNGVLVACTASHPYVITGQAPANMTMQKCAVANPCSSRASILGGDNAVSYISANGLIQVGGGGVATNTTDLWFTREKWQQLTPQKYARAIFLSSCYYCLGSVSPPAVSPVDVSVAQQGFTIELDDDAHSFTIWPQPGGHRLGFNVLTSPTEHDIKNVMTDVWSGTGMLISNGQVWYFDFSDALPAMVPYRWKSKVYQQNVKRSYSAMKVFFQVPTNTPAQNPTVIDAVASDPIWSTLPADSYGFVKTYVDVDGTGNLTLIDCREIRASGSILRIIDGFKADQWQWEIDGRVAISNVQIATSPKELGNV